MGKRRSSSQTKEQGEGEDRFASRKSILTLPRDKVV